MSERWLVTGVGRGIGLGVAERLLERGDRVVGSIRGETPSSARRLRERFGPAFELLAFDLGDDAAIHAAASSLEGGLDVLFNNAAVYGPRDSSAFGLSRQAFAETLDINTFGTVRVIEAFLPKLANAARPRVVAVSSGMGATTDPGGGSLAYRASKAALNKAMQVIGAELASRNVAVACLRPGWVRTDMGGPGAALEVHQSAEGLVAVVDGLQPSGHAEYLDYTGERLPW